MKAFLVKDDSGEKVIFRLHVLDDSSADGFKMSFNRFKFDDVVIEQELSFDYLYTLVTDKSAAKLP